MERLSRLRNASKDLIERKIFNIVVEGKERRISRQFRLQQPEVRLLIRKGSAKDRAKKEGFELCGLANVFNKCFEWVNGRTGLPEGASIKNYAKGKTKKISQFCEEALRSKGEEMDGKREEN